MSDVVKRATMSDVVKRAFLQGLPAELREEIYSYLVGSEGEWWQDYIGKGPANLKTDFCLPLLNLSPPTLVQVCKLTRDEYMAYYFKSTCFRIYLDLESASDPDWQHPPLVSMDPSNPASAWLQSLDNRDEVRFRYLQYRLTDRAGMPVGLSFIVSFDRHTETYKGDLRRDDGWYADMSVPGDGETDHDENTRLCFERVNQVIDNINRGGEGLSNKRVMELSAAFNITHVDVRRRNCIEGVRIRVT